MKKYISSSDVECVDEKLLLECFESAHKDFFEPHSDLYRDLYAHWREFAFKKERHEWTRMGVCDTCDTSYYNFIENFFYLIDNFTYHKKSLCFYVSQVSLKSFLGSERQGGSTGYATAVDFRSLQFHNEIASFAVAAHTLEPLLVEYLFVGSVINGPANIGKIIIPAIENIQSVTPKRNDKIKHFYNMFIEILQKISPHTALHTQLFVHRHNLGV